MRRRAASAPFRRSAGGFTLIELLLVVVIIGILAALVIPKFAGRSEDARKAAAQSDLKTIADLLEMYEGDLGSYPASDVGLDALITSPAGLKDPNKWKGPYMRKKEMPLDPWGNAYKYTYPGSGGLKTFELLSAGPDGQEGSEVYLHHYPGRNSRRQLQLQRVSGVYRPGRREARRPSAGCRRPRSWGRLCCVLFCDRGSEYMEFPPDEVVRGRAHFFLRRR